MARYVVVGGGIVGLATARAIAQAEPNSSVAVIEKEPHWAAHQTGRNSGVIHSGLYYAPGSKKALMCRAGAASMAEFARGRGVPVTITGKLVVATAEEEVPRLQALHQRGIDNGIPVRLVDSAEAREFEPHVAAVAALHVASTGIIDYRAVCEALADDLAEQGADLRLATEVTGLVDGARETVVETDQGPVPADVVVNCAGLQSDRVAAMSGSRPPARIVPFRGEYYELREDRRDLVRGLIYPVPDPRFPFLGVHLTKMVDGGVHAGPNAVLALAREGYDWRTLNARDLWDTLTYPGFWRLAKENAGYGLMEMRRSLSRPLFAAALARLVPEVAESDLVPSTAGVRAQAMRSDGTLVDDFLVLRRGRGVHVLNAPSPAATSALEIGRHVAAVACAA